MPCSSRSARRSASGSTFRRAMPDACIDAITLLHDVETGEAPRLGRRVIIYGGGNTAMDAARTARRLGAEEALIVYRRDRAHMPAHGFEADEALSEGIKIKWLSTIKEIGEARTHGRDDARSTRAAGRSRPDSSRRCQPIRSSWRSASRPTAASCAHVPGIAFGRDGTVVVDADMMTGRPGIFAGGDMVPSERTVTVAVGHGKKAARHIDAWLRGAAYARTGQSSRWWHSTMLHLPIYSDADPTPQRTLTAAERISGFDEVFGGLTRSGSAPRSAALPVLRQLLRMRQLLRRLPGNRDRQARPDARLPGGHGPVHRLRRVRRAMPVPRDGDGARTCPRRWEPSDEHANHDGRQHGRRTCRVSGERGLRDLSDHPVLAHGRHGRPVDRPTGSRTSGAISRSCRRCRPRAGLPAPSTARCNRAR